MNERGRFIDVFVGPPGKVHDSRMLRTSPFYEEWEQKMGEQKLLGNSAYCGNTYLFIITPKRDNGALSDDDIAHIVQLSRGRMVVEQAFGRMRCRWRRVREIQNVSLYNIVLIIIAACMLHNLCQDTEICDEHPRGCPRQGDDNNE